MQYSKSTLNGMHVFSDAIQLTRNKFLNLLPFSLSIALIYFLSGLPLTSIPFQNHIELLLTVLWVFVPSLVCSMAILLGYSNNHSLANASWMDPFIKIYLVYGVIVSMILTPLLFALIAIIGFWLLEALIVQFHLQIPFVVVAVAGILLGMTNKIFAPLFVFIDNEEINVGLEKSEQITKPRFIMVYMMLLLISLSVLIVHFIPRLLHLSEILSRGMSSIALFIVLPFCVAILVTIKERVSSKAPG